MIFRQFDNVSTIDAGCVSAGSNIAIGRHNLAGLQQPCENQHESLGTAGEIISSSDPAHETLTSSSPELPLQLPICRHLGNGH
jgi:hypothetical protein